MNTQLLGAGLGSVRGFSPTWQSPMTLEDQRLDDQSIAFSGSIGLLKILFCCMCNAQIQHQEL